MPTIHITTESPKTTPYRLHHTHGVMSNGYTGDENLNITNRIEVNSNGDLYIDDIKTGINLKGPAGASPTAQVTKNEETGVSTITITDVDGTVYSVEVKDGKISWKLI